MEEPGSDARLVFDSTAAGKPAPLFTIAVPHYNRRRYFELNLRSLFEQDSSDFEILVSDDHSGDDSASVLPGLLQESGRPARYYAQARNLGYDGNVRFCLANARGRYVFMLGNDDCLASPATLSLLAGRIAALGDPEVCVTNYQDWQTRQVTRRVYGDMVLGSGLTAAAHYFRLFSFTSGLVYERAAAARHSTARWDGSIYYQIYLACRILAAGGRLGAIDMVAVLDHIRLDGDLVPETYRVKYRDAPFALKSKHTGLDSVARVAIDAMRPFVSPAELSPLIRRVFVQLLTITYPYWIFEYRQLANWGMGFGIARDLWPGRRLAEYRMSFVDRAAVWATYLGVTAVALVFPAGLFNRFRHRIAAIVRRRRQRYVA